MCGTSDGRYAPSPTGELHLGNLRTALAAWLFARSRGAAFWLRIDDLDPDRSRPEHEAGQLQALRAIGLDWDGAPVRQSANRSAHDAALDELRRRDLVYPCFCSRAEVRAAASAPHGQQPDGAYSGACGRLAPSAALTRVAAGEPHCLRARADGAETAFVDGLLGPISGHVDDFVVRRRDGVPAYNLATVVDDAAMHVGEVVRGADLADNTPRQVWLAGVLDAPTPRYVHVPLVLGSDGARLAKRHGAVGLEALAARGVDAISVLSLLAESLGTVPRGTRVEDPTTLLETFDPAAIPRAPVPIDPARLGAGRPWSEAVRIDHLES